MTLIALLAFIITIATNSNLIAVYVVFAILTGIFLIGLLVTIVLHFKNKKKKSEEILKIGNFKVDLIKGLDLIHLIYKLPRFQAVEKPKQEISKWNPTHHPANHKPPIVVPSDGLKNPIQKPRVEKEMTMFNPQIADLDNDEYTIVKNDYFRFIESTHQARVNPESIAVHYNSRVPLQDISPSQFMAPRQLTFSENDNKGGTLFQSALKSKGLPEEKENVKVSFGDGQVFLIEDQNKEKNLDDQEIGFQSVKDDVDAVVYGDPQSESKLRFFEKVRKMKEKEGEFSKYDTLGAPPKTEFDASKLFPYLPD